MKHVWKSPIALALAFLFTLASCGSGSREDLFDHPEDVSAKYRTYYQLLVYSFADSNGDGIGDFKGIADKLDYLEDLGVKGLWLSPINKSPSYHSYDVVDYYGVKTVYEVDGYTFEDLIADAAARDIDIIMDLVLNHTGSEHAWFLEGQAAFRGNGSSKYKNWYNFSATKTNQHPSGSNGAYYEALFWSGMPDLNYDNAEVRAEMINVAKYWLAKGVSGFRLDAAMHIFTDYTVSDKWNGDVYDKNIEWWQEFQSALEADYPEVYLIGEMWTSLEKIKRYHASNLDSAFNFETKDQVTFALNGTDGFSTFLEDYQAGIREFQDDAIEAYFLSNHDDGRMAWLTSSRERLKMAASLQILAPGNAFVYYGDELGLRGTGSGDGAHRTPMLWGDDYVTDPNRYGIGISYSSNTITYDDLIDQENETDSLLAHYREVIGLKNEYMELFAGTLTAIDTGSTRIQAYMVSLGETKTIVIHNTDSAAHELTLTNVSGYYDGISITGAAIGYNVGQLTMPGYSSVLVQGNGSPVTIETAA
jgi:glycosidase